MSRYNNDDIMSQLQEIEDNVENLSNMVRHPHLKHDTKLTKLDKHIDFIEKTYQDLKNPLEGVKRFLATGFRK